MSFLGQLRAAQRLELHAYILNLEPSIATLLMNKILESPMVCLSMDGAKGLEIQVT